MERPLQPVRWCGGAASYTEPSHFKELGEYCRRVLGETMRGAMTRPECKLSGVGVGG